MDSESLLHQTAGRSATSYLMPIGAELDGSGGKTRFRVWAPKRKSVAVVFEKDRPTLPMRAEGNGYFSVEADGAPAGTNYKLAPDGGEPYPDPASRYQPTGPHGLSQVVDHRTFRWTDDHWKGIQLKGQVVYEMHVGTFTPVGTWVAASDRLQYLHDTGVTLIEVMPVADFPGRYGWGYDGVQMFAPASIYGTPDDMRRFVDRAHAVGLGVILDVVYNHVGPDGNYLTKFSPLYFSDKHQTDWGPGINYDAEGNGPVREFVRENAAYWVREFHLDGLRLDATQDIHDDSEPHILSEISRAARAATTKDIVLIGENEPQNTRLIRPPDEGGYGLDALWNDDLHHSAMVALTAKHDAYYTDYRGTPQEFVSAMKYGYLYQGQMYKWQGKRRGTSNLGLPREGMVSFIQNHDQIANSGRGLRVHALTSPGRYKALTALTLLGPGTPMLFQGQEFASSSKFLFFADHNQELSKLIESGRIEFLTQWQSLRLPEMRQCFANPALESTFQSCKLNFEEVDKHVEAYHLHRDLLRLRREDAVISRQGEDGIDGAVLSSQAFVLRYFSPGFESDRLLVVNLGVDLDLNPAPEPLLAPPADCRWTKLWSSDDPAYGGCGTPELDSSKNWRIPGEAAVVLQPTKHKPSK